MPSGPRLIDYYDILGVDRTATMDEIRAAYDARLRQYHLDRNGSTGTNAIVALIGEAGGVLGSRESRRVYDAELNRTGRPHFQSPRREATDTSPRTIPSDAPKLPKRQRPPASFLSDDSPIVLRLFGCGLIVVGGLFAWLGDQFRNHRGWLVLLFWVCLWMGISFLSRAGQRLRGMSSEERQNPTGSPSLVARNNAQF